MYHACESLYAVSVVAFFYVTAVCCILVLLCLPLLKRRLIPRLLQPFVSSAFSGCISWDPYPIRYSKAYALV